MLTERDVAFSFVSDSELRDSWLIDDHQQGSIVVLGILSNDDSCHHPETIVCAWHEPFLLFSFIRISLVDVLICL